MSLIYQVDKVAHPLLVDDLSLSCQCQQPFQGSGGLVCHLLISQDPKICSAVDDLNPQSFLDPFDIFIEGTKYGDQIFHPLRIDDPFNCFSHV